MRNYFWVACHDIVGTNLKLFLGSMKTSQGNTSYIIMALDCQKPMQNGVIGFNLANLLFYSNYNKY